MQQGRLAVGQGSSRLAAGQGKEGQGSSRVTAVGQQDRAAQN